MILSRRFLSLVAALALAAGVLAFVPLVVDGSDTGHVSPTLATYAEDAYESVAGGDDGKVDARAVTVPEPGSDPYVEYHTLDSAIGTSGDEDWYLFTVTTDDITHKRAFLIEAATNDRSTDPVIELYGPGLAWTPADAWLGEDSANALAINDDGAFMMRGSSLAFLPYDTGGAGTYRFRVRPYSSGGVFQDCAGPYTLRIKKGTLLRISGDTRITTAIEISQELHRMYPVASQSNALVVANAYDFPDALAGGLLCNVSNGGPMLLTHPDSLPSEVRAEIIRTGVDQVYVVGGEAAVSDDVLAQIQAITPGLSVTRVSGDNRYDTAAAIAVQGAADLAGGTADLAIVVSGQDFPDALAGSPMSVSEGVPILLTAPDKLSSEAENALGTLGTTDVVIIGGTAAVSPAVATRLATVLGGTDRVYRIAGDNRYETAKEFAAWACDIRGPGLADNGSVGTVNNDNVVGALDPYHVGIACGEDFPDALAGGALCGLEGFPLLLNPSSGVTDYIFEEHEGKLPGSDTDWFSDIGGEPLLTSRLFGGEAAIEAGTYAELDQFFGFMSN